MAAGVPPYGPGAEVAVGVGVEVAVGVGTPTCVKCIQLMLPMPPVEPFASITSLTTCAPEGSVAAPAEEAIVCQFGTPQPPVSGTVKNAIGLPSTSTWNVPPA